MDREIEKEERKLNGPRAYEQYNKLAKKHQKKYFSKFKFIIVSLTIIAFLSIIPVFNFTIDKILNIIKILAIIAVLCLIVLQYKSDDMEIWQKSRYLAETILSNSWYYVWGIKPFDNNNPVNNFIDRISELEQHMLSESEYPIISKTENHLSKLDISDWMDEFRKLDLNDKKKSYIEYRIKDQINWYNNKASFNDDKSKYSFVSGLGLMALGIVLILLVIANFIPNWSFLGFFTTVAVSIFSWSQARRFDELKVTYSISANELSKYKSKIEKANDEEEIIDIVTNVENFISHEHKIWFVKSNTNKIPT